VARGRSGVGGGRESVAAEERGLFICGRRNWPPLAALSRRRSVGGGPARRVWPTISQWAPLALQLLRRPSCGRPVCTVLLLEGQLAAQLAPLGHKLAQSAASLCPRARRRERSGARVGRPAKQSAVERPAKTALFSLWSSVCTVHCALCNVQCAVGPLLQSVCGASCTQHAH